MVPNDASATTASSKVSLTVESLLALTLSTNDITFSNVNPGTSGTFVSDDVTANVKTNNATGYTLTMSAKTNETAMTRTDTKPYTIPSITADTPVSTAATSFTNNTWGWHKTIGTTADTNYHPVPAPTTPAAIREIDHVPTTDPEKNTDITTGIKIGPDLPAGTYANTLTFSLVANYVPRMNAFWQANTMQDFTQQTCDAEITPAATATTIVTAPDDYTDPTTQVPQRTLQDTRDNKYYLVRKLADGNCWMVQNLDLELAGKTLTDQDTDLNSKASWTGAVAVQLGDTWTGEDYTPRYYSESDSQTDTGNFYTWSAATAGSIDRTYFSTIKEAPDSICPKNWQLPPSDGGKSWDNLVVSAYNISDDATGATKTAGAPLSLNRPGYYFYTSGQLERSGEYASWWSRTSKIHEGGYQRARSLVVHSERVATQSYNNVKDGISVRCVTH